MPELPSLLLVLRANASELVSTVKGATAEVEAMERKTSASHTKMQTAFAKTAGVGKGLTLGLGAAAIGVGIATTKMASDFQSKMTLLQTAAGEQSKNMKLVSDGILKMAGDTGTSTTQLAEGMYTVEKSGNRGAAGLKILQAAAEGAKAENVDLGVATNALTSVMMSYHLKAGDAVKVQNEMIAGSGLAKTSMQEYASSLSAVLPVASSAGIGFDQVGGAIATLTQHGTSAQEATQELANTIRGLQAPSQVSQKMMQQLGLNVTDVSQNLGKRGLTGTIDLITDAIGKHLGPSGLVVVDTFKKSQSAAADAQKELKALPSSMQDVAKSYLDGSITQKTWRADLKNMSVGQRQLAQEFAGTVTKSRGFNDLLKSGSPAAQTFAGTLNKVMGGATGMNTALMLGGDNMGYFKKATEEVGAAGQKTGAHISTWHKTQQNLAVQLAQVGHGAEAMGIKLGTVLIPFVSGAIKAIGGFVAMLVKNPPLLITLASLLGGFVVLMIGAYIAKITLAGIESIKSFAKMIGGGITWAAETAGSIGETLALWAMYFGEWVAQTASSVAETLGLWAMYAGEWIASTASSIAETLALWASYGAQWVAKMAVSAAKWVAGQAVAFGQAIVKGAAWVAAMTAQLAVAAAKWVASTAKTVAQLAIQNAAMLAQKAVMLGGAVATGIATAAQWAFNAAMDANPIGLIILAVAALIAGIVLLAMNWGKVTAFLGSAWAAFSKWFSAIVGSVVKWVKDNWGLLLSFLIGPLGLAIQWIVKNWGGIVAFFTSIAGKIASVWNGMWAGAGNAVKGAMNGVLGFIQGGINGAIDLIDGGIKLFNNVSPVKIPIIGHVSLPHFENGGRTPGALGQPSMAVVHGGEYMLSARMLSGKQPIDPAVRQAVAAAPSGGGQGASGGGTVTNNVTVNAQTNASPQHIAASVAWELWRQG